MNAPTLRNPEHARRVLAFQEQQATAPLLTKDEALAICRELDWPIDPDAADLKPIDTAMLKLRQYAGWPMCIDETLSAAEEHDDQFRTFVLVRGGAE